MKQKLLTKYSYIAIGQIIISTVFLCLSFSYFVLALLIFSSFLIVFDFFIKEKIIIIKCITFFLVFCYGVFSFLYKPLDKYLIAPSKNFNNGIYFYFSYLICIIVVFFSFSESFFKKRNETKKEVSPFFNEKIYRFVNNLSGKVLGVFTFPSVVASLYLKGWISLIINFSFITIYILVVIVLDKIMRKKLHEI